MAEFRFFTRGDSSVRGKARIYFTAHPDDYEKYFGEICKDILERQNCAIFCLDRDTMPEEVEDFELRMGEMQLLVVPVTRKLLETPNRAMDVEVPIATRKHIPILPLMQESGLDTLFGQKFGDLQYLDKYNADPTALPYSYKLTKYLESVIVGNELAEKVRAAFDAYVFLSYRKKDRKYAQELMRLIHSNPFCRDIAIWYDEYLTPGEDFNDAIRAALEKSGLFALTVTPNLINELNYVFSIEYPMARSLGKQILPIEMLPTDRKKLSEMYTGIPDPIAASDPAAMSACLADMIHRIAITSNDKDPQHNFFIGLAYLSGIDVEIDHERAVQLITEAAKSNQCVEARKKLASMYRNGEGVPRDMEKAILWQGAAVMALGETAEKTQSEDDGIACLREAMEYGEMAYSVEDFESAEDAFSIAYEQGRILAFGAMGKNAFGKVKNLWNKYVKRTSHFEEAYKLMVRACRMMVEIAFKLGIDEKINEWSQKALALTRAAFFQFRDAQTAVELLSFTGRMTVESSKSGNLTVAETLIGLGSGCWEGLPEEEKTFEVKLAYALFQDGLSTYYEVQANHRDAFLALEEKRKILGELSSEYPDNYLLRQELIRCRLEEVNICIEGGDLKTAQAILDQAKGWINVEEKSEEIDLLIADYRLYQGIIAYRSGRFDQAVAELKEGRELLQPLTDKLFDMKHQRTLVRMEEVIGDAYYALGQFSEAVKWHKDGFGRIAATNTFSKLVRDARTQADLQEKVLNDALKLEDRYDVSEYYEKALWLRDDLINGTETKRGFRKQTVAELAEKGKINTAIYQQEIQDLEKLKARKGEIDQFLKAHPPVSDNLLQFVTAGGVSLPEIYGALSKLISLYLKTHAAMEIRSDLENLQKAFAKVENPADITKDPSFSMGQFGKFLVTIYNHLHDSYVPFGRYEEHYVLLMAFSGLLFLYLSSRSFETDDGKAIYNFISRSVFWNYPLAKVEHQDLWQILYRFLLQLKAAEKKN